MSPQLKFFWGIKATNMGYSIQVKEAVLQKVLQGNKPHHEIAMEYGIGRSTIGKWLRQYKDNGGINLTSKERFCCKKMLIPDTRLFEIK